MRPLRPGVIFLIGVDMNIKTILTIIFFIIIPAGSISAQTQEVHQEIARKYLSYMSQNSFDKAAKLFHFPASYTQEKNESEFSSVKNSLERFKRTLGDIVQIVNYVPEGEFIGTGVSGAEIDYWSKNQKQSQQILIPCKFQKLEFGVIRILFCNIKNKFEIQSVDYSFIKSNESFEILKGISNTGI